ncbi:cytochrome ubiquinol oxidase subunit I [Erwinia oleae]|uniref:cytochrome ubiquinol oxidase subunit I n=1 Tax=Erwinia oleae TaxID=796334 RepID=UPI00068A51F9|nr:cytochrome ubiquinol oxidase subunit I [Erwinia oleae]
MPDADLTLLLSRGQFAVTIGLHIVLAAFALGLAQFLAFFEGMWLWTGDRRYRSLYRFWLKIFALTIAVGTVSGGVMEFQFATNWSELVRRTGGILGPLMLYEVLVAFFMESALAGVMIFGLDRIRPGVHFLVTLLVALGALISAFWILAANSWMQTPTGFTLDAAGILQPESWLTILLAPSFPWRLTHMVLAALLATAFLVAGVGAWRLLKGIEPETARLMLSLAMWLALILMPVQIIIGDLHGENTLEYQPQKVAAMEGNWRRPPQGEGEPLRLFAIPDAEAQRNRAEVAIPDIASLYLRHNLHGHIQSLSEFPKTDLPPVALVFFAFRLMVGLGIIMFAASLAVFLLRLRKRLYGARWLLKSLVLLSPAGFAAMLAGWVVTEVGRQPWAVWGVLRTAQGVSPLPSAWVSASLTAVVIIYAIAFAAGLRYFLHYVASPLPPDNAAGKEKEGDA